MSDTTPAIDVEQFASVHARDATVIDVREAAEYVEGHVPGAHLVPMGQLPGQIENLNRDEPVYVICASGNRSAAMTDLLTQSGINAYSVAGGTTAWADSGRQMATGTHPTG
jgi:rhodanese-related sulfurtransferase